MSAAKLPARSIGYTKAARVLRDHADPPAKSAVHRWYFKGPRDEIFLGITAPILREVAREFELLSLPDVRRLMTSKVHDERLLGCAILHRRYERGSDGEREKIFAFFVRNRRLVRSSR